MKIKGNQNVQIIQRMAAVIETNKETCQAGI